MNNFFGKAKKRKNGGFTVVETLFAILIVGLVVGGVFSAVQIGLSTTIISKDQITAYYLAQEAFEMIKNRRDYNYLYFLNTGIPTNWLSGIADQSTDPCYFGKVCRVDSLVAITSSLQECGTGWDTCPPIKQDSNYLYGYAGGNNTKFKREVKIESIPGGYEVSVTVRVSWSKGAVTREFKVRGDLLNWL